MGIKVNGLEELQAKLKRNVTLDDVKTVVHHSGSELDNNMKRQTSVAFIKGYSKGDTARSITMTLKDDGMTVTVAPETNYSPYVEYGTRFMSAEPFVRPAFDIVKPQFLEDLKKLCR